MGCVGTAVVHASTDLTEFRFEGLNLAFCLGVLLEKSLKLLAVMLYLLLRSRAVMPMFLDRLLECRQEKTSQGGM